MDLSRLLQARVVAVIGASERPQSAGARVVDALLRSGVEVLPVNPRRKTVMGIECTPSISGLPGDVDLAVVTLPAERAAAEAVAAAEHGIPFVIPVAGGFSEKGAAGQRLQDEMVARVRRAGSRLLGPNTIGLWVPDGGPDTIFVEHEVDLLSREGCVAFLSQSGSVGVESLGAAAPFGYRLRAFVSLGNKADLDECDFLDHFREDAGCGCLALYIESFKDGRRFLNAARQTALRKPIIALKAGRTEGGAGAVSSHTGALSGSHEVVCGAFAQNGILQVTDDLALLDGAKALALAPAARGGRTAVLTPAGGYGVMAADTIESTAGELSLARLSDATRERIRASSLEIASVDNPVDLTASIHDDMILSALESLLADEGVDLVLCMAFLAPPGLTDELVAQLARSVRGSPKPVVLVGMHGRRTVELCRRLTEAGCAAFPSLRQAIEAARLLVRRGRWLARTAAAEVQPRCEPGGS
ncbi:MAG: CoA-binding protein [Deltaproteobacteria bacterium]|nr:CoA-binding protein [Deltaproteobacteria bacterium]